MEYKVSENMTRKTQHLSNIESSRKFRIYLNYRYRIFFIYDLENLH